jgi:hypothetical protein
MSDQLTLDVGELRRRGVLAPGSRTRGVISWTGAASEAVASVAYEADMTNAGRSWLRLRFSVTAADGSRRRVDQRVGLTTTRPGFGGARWWFVVDGEKRVAQLRLSAESGEFRAAPRGASLTPGSGHRAA